MSDDHLFKGHIAALRVVFRCDASLEMGSGHVMRCLTLAFGLQREGAKVLFICRDLPGNLANLIRERGFSLSLLPAPLRSFVPPSEPFHASWAKVDAREDAEETLEAVLKNFPQFGSKQDWFVLDHYSFDACWQKVALPDGARLAVLDDLADRKHLADLLIDQNLGRIAADYTGLVQSTCKHLIGPRFSLLRPEFSLARDASLAGRVARGFTLSKILITMGGVDLHNASGKALAALQRFQKRHNTSLSVTVVLGSHAPNLEELCDQASKASFACQVKTSVSDMSALMCEADLAIGAAGSTSWERCALGLPSLIAVLAENQISAAIALEQATAAFSLGRIEAYDFDAKLDVALDHMREASILSRMSDAASQITDGAGTKRVVNSFAELAATLHGQSRTQEP